MLFGFCTLTENVTLAQIKLIGYSGSLEFILSCWIYQGGRYVVRLDSLLDIDTFVCF